MDIEQLLTAVTPYIGYLACGFFTLSAGFITVKAAVKLFSKILDSK